MSKIVLITGCSSGYGRLFVKASLSEGWTVYATVRKESDRDDLTAEFADYGKNLRVLFLDVCHPDMMREFVDGIESLDYLVNNAGVICTGSVLDLSEEEERHIFDVNFWGGVRLTKMLIPTLLKSKSPKIVNVSSLSGVCGFPGISFYSASKHALEGFYESIYAEMKLKNIRVVNILPGVFNTRMMNENRRAGTHSSNQDSLFRDVYSACSRYVFDEIFAKHAGNPEIVAKKIIWILKKKRNRFRYFIGYGAAWFALSEKLKVNNFVRYILYRGIKKKVI
jgi:NAD(P)-dependent dehydrogenase (short-subunit alcohol dehydrogenase family)